MNYIIEIENLVKKYDTFTLGELNLKIPKGEIVGLIGENGAGKTTLIKALLGIIKPTRGRIKLFDNYVEQEADNTDIGVVLDNMFFPELLTVKDIDSIMKDIYPTWDCNFYNEQLSKFGIPMDKPLKKLSKGMRKKVEIVTALAHHPKLLILDEPTSGLDPVVRSEVLDIFLDFIQDEEHTILMSTHITSDLEHIADRIVFIENGKVSMNDAKDEILDNYGILKCDLEDFGQIDEKDMIAYKKNRYNYDILVDHREEKKKKYKKFCIDKITLEDLMLLMIKGERR